MGDILDAHFQIYFYKFIMIYKIIKNLFLFLEFTVLKYKEKND